MTDGSDTKHRRAPTVLLRDDAAVASGRRDAFARAVHDGLAATPKDLSRVRRDDATRPGLIDEIRELPGFYLARAERQILTSHANEIAARFRAEPPLLVELGANDPCAVRPVVSSFLTRHGRLQHVAIDEAVAGLEQHCRRFLDEFPRLESSVVTAEHAHGLRCLPRPAAQPRVILWLGSAIGALDRTDATGALHAIAETMRADDVLLVGVDLRKDARALERAYCDPSKLMSRRALGLLTRIDEELGGDFDTSRFRYRAEFLEDAGRVEMSLVSRRRHGVRIRSLALAVAFKKGEAVLTEVAYKYSPAEIDAVAHGAGLIVQDRWYDRDGRFSLNLMRHVPLRRRAARDGARQK